MGRATHHQMARPQVVAVCVLGAACAALLLAVAGQSARRSELLGGLLPLKGSHQFDGVPLHHYRHYHPDDNQAWSDMNWRTRTAIAPHGSGHRIFAPLDEPVTHSITSDIPNMVDTAMETSNNYEDKLNRKLLRLQREKAALAQRRQDIIDGLVSDRNNAALSVSVAANSAENQRLESALERARAREWAIYQKATKSFADSESQSRAKADEYLSKRNRASSRIKELDDMLTHGDEQMATKRETWNKEWAPYELAHPEARSATSGSSSQGGDLEALLSDIQGQAAALGGSERNSLLDKLKKLHDIIDGGGAEEKPTLAIPDKRSWRKMSTGLEDFAAHLNERSVLDTNEPWNTAFGTLPDINVYSHAPQ